MDNLHDISFRDDLIWCARCRQHWHVTRRDRESNEAYYDRARAAFVVIYPTCIPAPDTPADRRLK